jgi:hypothetical protein
VDYLSNTSIDDLTPAAQNTVKAGIGADSQAEALKQLQSLLDPSGKNVLPYCPPKVTVTTPPATPSPNPNDLTSPTPGATSSTFTVEPVQPTGPPDCRPAIR